MSSASDGGPARRGERTRAKLLDTAEQLFAEQGVEAVTLRLIGRSAGQSNVSAVQYHFGDKQQLLAAVLARHVDAIDEERRGMLARLDAEGRGEDLDALLHVLVDPLARRLDDPSGRAYLQVQAQPVAFQRMRPATRSMAQRTARALGAGERDPQVRHFAALMLFAALADRARAESAGRARASRESFVAALARSLGALFAVRG